MVMNLCADHDIQGMDVGDIADKLLESFGDTENEGRYVTHILYNHNISAGPTALALPERLATNGNRYKNAAIVQGDFNNPARPTVHSGYAIVRKVMDLLERQTTKRRQDTLDIYVDLLSRSIAFDSILQEFLELPWQQQFCKVRLHVNQLGAARSEASPVSRTSKHGVSRAIHGAVHVGKLDQPGRQRIPCDAHR